MNGKPSFVEFFLTKHASCESSITSASVLLNHWYIFTGLIYAIYSRLGLFCGEGHHQGVRSLTAETVRMQGLKPTFPSPALSSAVPVTAVSGAAALRVDVKMLALFQCQLFYFLGKRESICFE